MDTLSNKVAELEALLSQECPDVMGLCEIFPKYPLDKQGIHDLKFADYDVISPVTTGERGVMLLVRKTLKANLWKLPDNIKFCENVWCEINLPDNDSLVIGMVYRSPSSSPENNKLLLDMINHSCKQKCSHYLLMGDFNFKDINWSTNDCNFPAGSAGDNFYQCVNDNFLFQHVRSYTRFRDGQNPSCLDLLFTNEDTMVDPASIVIDAPLGRSDHSIIHFNMTMRTHEGQSFERYQYFKGDYDKLRHELNSTDWNAELSDKSINEMWDKFSSILNKAVSDCIPKKNTSTNCKSKPLWMNKDATVAILAKKKAWKSYKYSRSQESYSQYALARDKCSKVVKDAKKSYEKKIACESKSNSKAFWKYVNSKRKTKDSIGVLNTPNNSAATTDQEKTETLNTFFSSVFVQNDSNFNPDLTEDNVQTNLCVMETCPEEVLKVLSSLNPEKSPGPDEVHPKVLSECKHELCNPLSIVFNQSLKEGAIPNDWKLAIVTPLFKKGSKKDPSNYRPISLTSVICKVLETLIRNRIMEYLSENHLLADEQYGFRPGRSCAVQLLEILEEWTKLLDEGVPIDVIYLDFSKAFDSVSHSHLLYKLHKLGIQGKLLEWLESFLSERQQRVRIGSSLSSWAPVVSGVPQGSVLGPILFLCFINDLPDVVSGIVKIFADDTKIYSHVPNQDLCDKLQTDLDNLCKWSDEWKLSFNVKKCKVLHIGKNNSNCRYSMPDKDGNYIYVEPVQTEKDLGVTFDENLSFEDHISNITSKAQGVLSLIHRSFEYLDKEMFLTLYKSLIRPILEYGSCVWSPFQKKDIKKIEDIQKRATKLVSSVADMPYEQRLKELGLVTLEYRRDRADMLQIYKSLHGLDSLKWDNMFQLNQSNLRGHFLKFTPKKCNRNRRLNSFSQRTIHYWNNLSNETINAKSINSFKSLLNKENWNAKKFKSSVY